MSIDYDRSDMSVAELDDLLGEHPDYDGQAGFTDTFEGLVSAAAQRSAAESHLKSASAALLDLADSGKGVTRDGRFIARKPPRPTTKRRVSSARVQKLDPALWKAAQAPVNRVQVYSPVKKVLTPADVGLPAFPKFSTESLLAAKEAAAKITSATNADTKTHKARLLELAEMMGWDGRPVRWTCGWSGHLWVLQYSEERLKEIAPDRWEELAVNETTAGKAGFEVKALDTDDEQDEIDGR